MGMTMSAYMVVGKTNTGANELSYAPLEHFHNVELVSLDENTPSFCLSTDYREILHDALNADFEEGYLSLSNVEVHDAVTKLDSQAEKYLKNYYDSLNYYHLYKSDKCRCLVQFFEVCDANQYHITAL